MRSESGSKAGFLEFLEQFEVRIPMLQRDYAQGRDTKKIKKVRNDFLASMFSVLQSGNDNLELDFIYGYTKHIKSNKIEEEIFYPLDGQQRLTTLFLLHWYIAFRENKLEEIKSILSKFTYETRRSSRLFCNHLVTKEMSMGSESISTLIKDQSWFFAAWKNDPTISAMLTMLNAIEEKYTQCDIKDAWEVLSKSESPIFFYWRDMVDIGNPDDLYIKMNSRGKELTEFEYFKSQISDLLKDEYKPVFQRSIDHNWADLFWDLYKDKDSSDLAGELDAGFIRFINYLADFLRFEEGSTEYSGDRLINQDIFSKEEKVQKIFRHLDKLFLQYKADTDWFKKKFYTDESEYEDERVRLFFGPKSQIDLFKKCISEYRPDIGSSSRAVSNPFSIGEQLLLYAMLVILDSGSEIPNPSKSLRKIRNLIAKSEDYLRKENLGELIKDVEKIIITGEVGKDMNLNLTQIDDEIEKEDYLQTNEGMRSTFQQLEDHELLQGGLSLFDIKNISPEFVKTFQKTFNSSSNFILIHKALLTLGDYSQNRSNSNLYRFGTKRDTVWRELFTRSVRRLGFEETASIIQTFILQMIDDPDTSPVSLIENYLSEYMAHPSKPKDWKYYFIKYEEFLKSEYGYFYWEDISRRYEVVMMRRASFKGFNWDPFLYTLKERSGRPLELSDYSQERIYLTMTKNESIIKIYNKESGFLIEPYPDEGSQQAVNVLVREGVINPERYYLIDQEDGIDTEDRIQKGLELINKLSIDFT